MESIAELESIEGLTEVEGWEETWLIHRDDPEDQGERDRRFGRISQVLDSGDQYVATVTFPSRVPNHPLRYRYGMPAFMPDYAYQVELDGRTLWVHASLEDPLNYALFLVFDIFVDDKGSPLP